MCRRLPVVIFLLVILINVPLSTAFAGEQFYEGKHGVYYQIFVRSWADGNGDGLGDLRGIIERLDYLEYLGVDGLWLTPFHPSPTYHKYDVRDYYDIDPEIGTIEELKELIAKAGERGIKILMDLVVNHTSSTHPWFLEALRGKQSEYRDYYIWADTETNPRQLGPWGQRVWHQAGSGYYYGLFWEEMPDLNLSNPRVRQELKNIAQYWLELGIAGFRLDAAKHIFEHDRTKRATEWWDDFSKHVRQIKADVYLIAEVWDSTFVVSPYFGPFDSNFNFDLAGVIMQVVNVGLDTGLVQSIISKHSSYAKHNEWFIDAPFLSNHDQNRSMSFFNSIAKGKIAASIYLTLPGNPFIYYGEEIGMKGIGEHENIREPFKWYSSTGEGQTTWRPIVHNGGDWQPSVQEQKDDPESLLNHYRDLLLARKSHDALRFGYIAPVELGNRRVISFQRVWHDEKVLVLHNVGSTTQMVHVPVELWGSGIVLYGGSGNSWHIVDDGLVIVELLPRKSIIVH